MDLIRENLKQKKQNWSLFEKMYAFVPILLVIGCATPAKEPEKKEDTYTLNVSKPQKNFYPLPTYIPIYVGQLKDQKTVKQQIGYKGWDFNDDGLIDMLEILEKDGATQSYAIDFNFDGKVDVIKKKNAQKQE